jgi:ABC-type transport system involved in multi-copper enzyme maturation permease subunit
MKAFWTLFKKEFRFLARPVIAMLVLLFFDYLWVRLELHLFPDYFNEILPGGQNRSPLLLTFYYVPFLIILAIEFLFPAILLYTVLYEQKTHSRYQLFMLPVTRRMHLAAKFAAFATWLAGLYIVYILFLFIVDIMNDLLTFNYLRKFGGMSVILVACALFLFAYVVAASMRRLRFVVGTCIVLAGYFCIQWVGIFVRSYIAGNYPQFNHGDALNYLLIITFGFMMLLFLVTALVLYENTSEI